MNTKPRGSIPVLLVSLPTPRVWSCLRISHIQRCMKVESGKLSGYLVRGGLERAMNTEYDGGVPGCRKVHYEMRRRCCGDFEGNRRVSLHVCSEKRTVPRKTIGTLTSSILNSVHTPMSPIFLYKLCLVATPKHSQTFLLENYVRIVAFAPDLQKVSFYSTIELLTCSHSSTLQLLLLLIFMKGSFTNVRPCVPRHTRGTLTSSNTCSVHSSMLPFLKYLMNTHVCFG